MTQLGKYPETFYRVSLKVIIRNEKGEVLVVKESTDFWGLPGGGLEHGESDIDCIKRELFEEVKYSGEVSDVKIISIESAYLENRGFCVLYVICEPKLDNHNFSLGSDCKEVAFIDPKKFKNSEFGAERQVYEVCVDKNAKS